MAVIVDTGPLYGGADLDDELHELASAVLSEARGPLVVPTPVLTEAEYLIHRFVGMAAARALLADTVAGALSHSPVEQADLRRALGVIESHPGVPLSLTDAAIVAQAERMRIRTILTFDHRDFRRVRPAHVRAFDLIPSEADLIATRRRGR